MSDVVLKVKSVASRVREVSNEISEGNSDLTRRFESQSQSLNKTSALMINVTQAAKRNADSAGHADELVTTARGQAERGGQVVKKAVSAMAEINDSAGRIADIIGVVDEIAFQTNLLALNAAVEAARAGEQGRGFAVVAAEVRSLAGRSAAAAKEIKGLIEDSVFKVEIGSALVRQSGETLEHIVASVGKVSQIVAEIAAASREQTSGIAQVNEAVGQIEEMTQHNASVVEQAALSSEAMAAEARELTTLIERFRMDSQAERSRVSKPLRELASVA
jgi:methyl-accepting chemotaxis protein